MSDIIREGQTRIDQYDALHWAWLMLRNTPKQKAITRIKGMLTELARGTLVDFEALIKGFQR